MLEHINQYAKLSLNFTIQGCVRNSSDMPNSAEPDQTAPLGAVWSWSALFGLLLLVQVLWNLTLNDI